MSTIDELIKDLEKKPETFKEKWEDFRLSLRVWYENWILDPLYGIKNFFRNIIRYREILWNDKDWDFDFFLNIQEKKLTFMLEYFKDSNICVEDSWICSRLQMALNLLKVTREKDYNPEEKPLFWTPYVNTKNARRFHEHWDTILKMTEGKKDGIQMAKFDLRNKKSWVLYHKCLEQYTKSWWD